MWEKGYWCTLCDSLSQKHLSLTHFIWDGFFCETLGNSCIMLKKTSHSKLYFYSIGMTCYWWELRKSIHILLVKSTLNTIWMMANTTRQGFNYFSRLMYFRRKEWMQSCVVVLKVDKRKRVRDHFCLLPFNAALSPHLMQSCEHVPHPICHVYHFFMFVHASVLWTVV